jgi:hypothetical protein
VAIALARVEWIEVKYEKEVIDDGASTDGLEYTDSMYEITLEYDCSYEAMTDSA